MNWNALVAFAASQWDVHPERVGLLVLLGALYIDGVFVIGRRWGKQASGAQVMSFGLGWIILAITIASPLHHLADYYLFSAHMVQHELLTLVVPPLLLLGTPGWLLRPLLNRKWVVIAGGSQIYPVAAFAALHLFFSLVHLPAIYDQVFRIEVAHAGVHSVLLVTGLLTWLPIFSPVPDLIPRLSVPGQMLYCFLATLPATMVGALITLSDGSLYSYYAAGGPLTFGISPIDDQSLGGLIMWVIGGTYYYGLLTALFFVWAHREEVHAYGR